MCVVTQGLELVWYLYQFCSCTMFILLAGKDSQSCSVHMINEGLRISGRNASIHFTGTGPVESYFCRMDDSDFFRCKCSIAV